MLKRDSRKFKFRVWTSEYVIVLVVDFSVILACVFSSFKGALDEERSSFFVLAITLVTIVSHVIEFLIRYRYVRAHDEGKRTFQLL